MIYGSGKKIIASGVKILSRGDVTEDIMEGNSLLTCFPFHLKEDQRSRMLVPWINSWWTGRNPLIHLSADRTFVNVFV